MSQKTIEVKLATAQELLYEGSADLVIANAYDGEVGIKPGHAPFISLLKPGKTVILNGANEEVFYVASGAIEVQPNVITILADHAERGKDIDEARAEQARKNAEKLLHDKTSKIDYHKLQIQLAQSIAQLRALQRFRKQIEKRRS